MGAWNLNSISKGHKAKGTLKNKKKLLKHGKTQSRLFYCRLKRKSFN